MGKIHISRNIIFDDENFGVQIVGDYKAKEEYDPWLSALLL